MILDTIVIQSPTIPEFLAKLLEQFCDQFSGINLGTGEVKYQFTSGSLMGSFDSRISVKVQRERMVEEWVVSDKKGLNGMLTGKKRMHKEPCEPYLRVECSLHKAMLGYNVFGGPVDLLSSVRWLVGFLESHIHTRLPYFYKWVLYQIDVAHVFDLGSFEAVQEWIRGMNNCSFPRRKVMRYGSEAVFCPGRNTSLKFYHKGPEFYKHDRKRLRDFLEPNRLDTLQRFANNLLRCEVAIKRKKLSEDYGGQSPEVWKVTQEYLTQTYEKEVSRMIREAKKDLDTVRSAENVQKRLFDVFSKKQAGPLLGTWYQLATLGEDLVKTRMTIPTFYRHRKLLVDAGCSWLQTDVVLKEFSLIPDGFVPICSDIRRVEIIHQVIRKKLKVA